MEIYWVDFCFHIGMIGSMTISEFLEANELTRAKFARLIGVNEASITRYMNGTRVPRREHLDRIYKVTKGAVTANDVLNHEAVA